MWFCFNSVQWSNEDKHLQVFNQRLPTEERRLLQVEIHENSLRSNMQTVR